MPTSSSTSSPRPAGNVPSPSRISLILDRIAEHVAGFQQTTLAGVENVYRDPFHLLVSCVISLRTKDAVTRDASHRLFEVVESAADLAGMDPEKVGKLIYPAGFYRRKGEQLVTIAGSLVEQFGGKVPDTLDALLALPGVGRKTANLVLGLGYGIPSICVDTHVHRISNRLGWVKTKRPDETEMALREILPKALWIPVNDILVTFGQNTCKPRGPLCGSCPVAAECPSAVGR